MDSTAGYYALEQTKKCNPTEPEIRKTFMAVVRQLEDISRKHGRAAVCEFVDTVEQRVLDAVSDRSTQP